METRSFNSLVEQFLGRGLPRALADGISFPDLPAEARGVILRMLALMKRASCPATEFNPQMIFLLSVVTPGMLPSAWGGRIPPVTSPRRHRKLDAYAAHRAGASRGNPPVFLDMGCGFPPATTADTAAHLPDWMVFGVDRSFARYALYDPEGRYACFDRDGAYQYCQSPARPLEAASREIRTRFESRFADLSSHLSPSSAGACETVEKDGWRIVSHPVREFEAKNLKFIESEIEDLRLGAVRVIRCMNVLLYFEKMERDRIRSSMGRLLDDGGWMISGMNHPFGIYARYAVHHKDADGISPVEFAFSPDNLRPLGVAPWLTLQEEDEEAELLADLTGAIRADRIFWPEFNRYVDALREQYGVCRRGEDGFIQFTEETRTAPPQATLKKTEALWRQLDAEGYTDGAVEALRRAGYTAWKNPAGDIAVSPPAGVFAE